MKKIIAVFGNMGHGKSTVADMLSKETGGRVINFADPVKEVGRVMIGIPHSVSHGSQSAKATNYYYGKSAREHLQWIGTEVGKDGVSPRVWVDRFLDAAMEHPSPVIIAGDGRFPEDEASYLTQEGEKRGADVLTIVVRRPSVPVDVTHRSESVIAETPNEVFDYVLSNTGTLGYVEQKVSEFLGKFEISDVREDRDDFIRTYSGKKYYPLEPAPRDVEAIDIAHGLAKTDRWNRQARVIVSVGLHCVNVMKVVALMGHPNTPLAMLYALLHDAHEAYLADVPRPVKKMIPWWTELERKNDRAIFEQFGIEWPMPPSIHGVVEKADKWLATIEGCEFTTHDPRDLGQGPPEELVQLAGVDWSIDGDIKAVRELYMTHLTNLLALNAARS